MNNKFLLNENTLEKLGSNTQIKVNDIKKTRERMFYDAQWEVSTDIGIFIMKIYDGVSNFEMQEKCRKVKTLQELNDVQPKHFYFD